MYTHYQVYLCSHTQDKNIVSAEHMAALYPGNFTYKVLPHTVYGEGTELEEELLNRCIEAFTSSIITSTCTFPLRIEY